MRRGLEKILVFVVFWELVETEDWLSWCLSIEVSFAPAACFADCLWTTRGLLLGDVRGTVITRSVVSLIHRLSLDSIDAVGDLCLTIERLLEVLWCFFFGLGVRAYTS